MASRGFEFAGNINGQNSPPVIRDLPVDGTGAYAKGDLVLLNSDGQCAACTNTVAEVTGVIAEARSSGTDGAELKVAIITPTQIWKCSMDAATTAAVVGYTKTIDLVDKNTIDADDISNGSMILWNTDTDDDGNVLAHVIFSDTTFGNS